MKVFSLWSKNYKIMFAIWTLNPSRILQKLWSPIRTPNPSWSPPFPTLLPSIPLLWYFKYFPPTNISPIVRLNTFPGKNFLLKKITLFLHYFLLSILKEHTASLSFLSTEIASLSQVHIVHSFTSLGCAKHFQFLFVCCWLISGKHSGLHANYGHFQQFSRHFLIKKKNSFSDHLWFLRKYRLLKTLFVFKESIIISWHSNNCGEQIC